MEHRLKLALVAIIFATPSFAGGSMAPEVRVIRVSPSIWQYGSKADVASKLESQRQQGRVDLENQRSANRRALEADKAYYAKLKDQRKHK